MTLHRESRAEAGADELPRPVVTATDPSTTFSNNTYEGINRIVNLDPYVLVNNIGKNNELWQLGPRGPGIARRGLFNTTVYPGTDLPSIFDLDAHAAFLSDGGRTLLLANHYGVVRYFLLPLEGELTLLQPVHEEQFLGDTERILYIDGCLVTTPPRGHETLDPPAQGLFISQRLPSLEEGLRKGNGRLGYTQVLPEWDAATALAYDPTQRRLAIGGSRRIGVYALDSTAAGPRIGDCLWTHDIDVVPQWLRFDTTSGRLLVAGYDADSDDRGGTDWDALDGGRLCAFSLDNGDSLLEAPMPPRIAWGYGADAVVSAADGRALYAVDRRGALYAVSTESGESRRIFASPEPDADGPSLGIGHCEVVRGSIYAGFSRGGYRLFRYDLPEGAL